MPDAMRALAKKQPIIVPNQNATMPWQQVFEPLEGYLLLAEALAGAQASNNNPNPYCEAFNFGPMLEANRTVLELIEAALQHWNGEWRDLSGAGVIMRPVVCIFRSIKRITNSAGNHTGRLQQP